MYSRVLHVVVDGVLEVRPVAVDPAEHSLLLLVRAHLVQELLGERGIVGHDHFLHQVHKVCV